MTTRTRARILTIAAAVLALLLLACTEPPGDPSGDARAQYSAAATRAARGTRAAESATIETRVTRQAARAQATNDAVLEPRD